MRPFPASRTPGWPRKPSGRPPSTASPPTVSAPNRPPTRPSRGSSKSWGSEAMRKLLALVAASTVSLTASQVTAADLVIWWQTGLYPGEDGAVREMIAAFETEAGKQVELDFYPPWEMTERAQAALGTGERMPDFAYNGEFTVRIPEWAYE